MFLKIDRIGLEENGNEILREISFTQARSQKLAIVGETGSGKSTLLKIIAGLVQPDSGEVVLDGGRIKGPHEQLVAGHAHIPYLSQHFELPKFLRVEQVLHYANVLSTEKANALFNLCDIAHLLARKTDELSGGEKQRVALARILISSPRLVLLDEPFSNLDMVHKSALKQVIERISRQLKIACIMVSHDPEDILPWADQIVVLRLGAIVQKGTPMQVYNHPADEYVAGLFGKFTFVGDQRVLKKLGLVTATIIRPHEIVIGKKHPAAIKARVDSVNFYGGFYELTVNVMDTVFYVHTTANFEEGDVITIRYRRSPLLDKT